MRDGLLLFAVVVLWGELDEEGVGEEEGCVCVCIIGTGAEEECDRAAVTFPSKTTAKAGVLQKGHSDSHVGDLTCKKHSTCMSQSRYTGKMSPSLSPVHTSPLQHLALLTAA